MSGRIFKYRIHANASGTTRHSAMRVGAIIRAVGVQQPGEVCLWAEVPYDVGGEKLESRHFIIVPTGGDVPDSGTYVGTAFDGPFVWHVYEVAS